LKIAQTPYMKNLDKIEIMSKAESNFLKVIVRPLWSVINSFLSDELAEEIQILNDNIIEWEKISNNYAGGIDKKKSSFLKIVQVKEEETKEEKSLSLDNSILHLPERNNNSIIFNPVSRRTSQMDQDEMSLLNSQTKKRKSFKKVDFSVLK